MVINLAARIGKLEATAGFNMPKAQRVVRLVVNDGEEAEAYLQAAEMGLNTSPDSDDLLIIRLVVPAFSALGLPKQ
ncbi:hypothetical protein [Pararhizobium sp.]|uniref:hypothetical protein n=1 Tax=Pararhizobium sp. TaxID=1977563 RepID=UPI00271CE7C1|nr:hypothetical protein [Pararhizobium sp.]MDO9416213.1 hypothetical protein [Pararhizobium sp.]